MCQIAILSIFSLGAQDSDLVHFLEMEKLSEIKPPLGLYMFCYSACMGIFLHVHSNEVADAHLKSVTCK